MIQKKRYYPLFLLFISLSTLPLAYAEGQASFPELVWGVLLIAVLGFSSFLTGLFYISKYNEMKKMTNDPDKLGKCIRSAGIYTLIVPAISLLALKITFTFIAASFIPIQTVFPIQGIFVFLLIMVLLATIYGILRIVHVRYESKAELQQRLY